MSLRGVMAIIDQVSYREVGFDPEQLVRTDPTVAKAVSEILQEYTNEVRLRMYCLSSLFLQVAGPYGVLGSSLPG